MELSSAFICDGATPSTSDDIASLHPSLPSLALTCEIYSVSESPVVFAGALKSLAEWASDIGDVGCGNDVAVVRVRVGRSARAHPRFQVVHATEPLQMRCLK